MTNIGFEDYSIVVWYKKKLQAIKENKEAIKNTLAMLLTILGMFQAYYAGLDTVWMVVVAPALAIFLKWLIDTIDYCFTNNPK